MEASTLEIHDFVCEWRMSERDIKLQDMARQYHAECEAFDRTVCTGPIREGSIAPADYREMAAINRNAHKVMRRLSTEALGYGIERHELMRAIAREA